MSLTPQRTYIQKADLALAQLTSDGGLAQPVYAKQFVEIAIESSKVLERSNVVPLKTSKRVFDKGRFSSRIMRRSASGSTLSDADRSAPTLSKVELTATEFKAEVDLTDALEEDNIEGLEWRDSVLRWMARATARDMDELLIQGDTGSGDNYLASFNGLIAGTTSNVVEANTVNLSKTILKQIIKAMPNEFRADKSRLIFLTSLDAEQDYINAESDRNTIEGDRQLREGVATRYGGSEIVGVPKFPENPTKVIYTDPDNILVGVQREMRFEMDRDVRSGKTFLVATVRWGHKQLEETASVKAINVKTTG